jgi:hypothetical protein
MAELEAWMRVRPPLEVSIFDAERIIDAWQSGGVKGILLGPLRFDTRLSDTATLAEMRAFGSVVAEGTHLVPAFAPNPTVYRRYGVVAPGVPDPDLEERFKTLGKFLDLAKRRSMAIWLIDPGDGMAPPDPGLGGIPDDLNHRLLIDDAWRRAFLARMADAVERVPQADGVVLTRPSWGWSAGMAGRDDLLGPLPTDAGAVAADLGLDIDRLEAALERLRTRLRKLTREGARLGANGGAFGTATMLGLDPGIVSLFAFRARALSRFALAIHDVTERIGQARGRELKFGLNPPAPSFAPLAGYDFPSLATICDLVVPRLGIHHRGHDGIYGIVSEWVAALNGWSSSLWEAESFEATAALMGISLPSTEPNAKPGARMVAQKEFDRGYPETFWREVVEPEARRSVAQADGYPWRTLPMVAGGRRPMGGDAIGVSDFRRLLESCRDGGVRQVVHYDHARLTAGEWSVLSEFSGSAWRAGSGYEPPDL